MCRAVRVRSLLLRDVLDARDAYHVNLLNTPNVVATAVGSLSEAPGRATGRPESVEGDWRSRRACGRDGCSKVRRCIRGHGRVLVFVDHWVDDDEIDQNPDAMVPRRLHLPRFGRSRELSRE